MMSVSAPRRMGAVVLAGALAMGGVAGAKQKTKPQIQADLAKVMAKWDEARKQPPVTPATCASVAKEFTEIGSDNNVAEGYFNAGVIWAACADTKKAQASYDEALRANPKFAPAMVNLGEIAFRAGDISTAQRQFQAALAADPKNVQAYNDVALIQFEQATRSANDPRLINEAIQNLRRALAVDAESMAAYNLLALIYYTTAESDPAKLRLAELICNNARETNDKYAPIYNTLGLIKLKRKDVTGALQQFRLAAQNDPKYVEANLNIGAITLSVRDYKSAEEAFKAVLDARPSNQGQLFDATVGMGVALRGQRRIDEAEQWYGKAKQLNPKDCSVTYNLGVLYQDYKSSSEPELNRAKALFNEFTSCGRATKELLGDAARRVKDIDATFAALAEAKKLEEEARKLQEEAARMEKEQQERDAAQKKEAPPPAPAPTPVPEKTPGAAPAPPAPKGAK